MINPILFYTIAAAVILGAVAVVRAANIFHAGLCLVLCFGAVAALYAMLDAHFIAAVQLLIYVGAIAVILTFAVMLTQHIGAKEPGPPLARQLGALTGCALFAVLVLRVIYAQTWPVAAWTQSSYISAKNIGLLFLGREKGQYLFGFEVVGVLLLMALVAAAMVASKEES